MDQKENPASIIHLIIYAPETHLEDRIRSILEVLGKIVYIRMFNQKPNGFSIWEVMIESVTMKIPERMHYMTDDHQEAHISLKVLNHNGTILRVNYSSSIHLCEYLKEMYACYNYIFSNTMSGTDNEALVWMISTPVLPSGDPSKLQSLLEGIHANGREIVKDVAGDVTMTLKFP